MEGAPREKINTDIKATGVATERLTDERRRKTGRVWEWKQEPPPPHPQILGDGRKMQWPALRRIRHLRFLCQN